MKPRDRGDVDRRGDVQASSHPTIDARLADAFLRASEVSEEGHVVVEAVRATDGSLMDLRLVHGNPRYWSMTGLDPETAIGRTIPELAGPRFDRSKGLFALTFQAMESRTDHLERAVPIQEQLGPLAGQERAFDIEMAYRDDFLSVVFRDVTDAMVAERLRESVLRRSTAIARFLTRAVDPAATQSVALEQLAEEVAATLGDVCLIMRVQPGGAFEIGAIADGREGGHDADQAVVGKALPASGIVRDRIMARETVFLPDIPADVRESMKRSAADVGGETERVALIDGLIAAPILAAGTVAGGIVVLRFAGARRYTPDDVVTVETLASVGGMVLARISLETNLLEAQKMEAVGQLAGGVAHDFNNLLTAIGGYSELLGTMIDDDELLEYVEQIQRASNRAADLTRQLLAFSRHQALLPTVLDLNEMVARLQPLLARLLGERVRVVVVPAPLLSPVFADRSQLETVLVNLALNARDAMTTGGTLTIATANAQIDDAPGGPYPAIGPGSYATISVTDTGMGIEHDTLPHIFEPFFTTKRPGLGTGLGLAMVDGTVRQSGGHVAVRSSPGEGATFTVFLPRSELEPMPESLRPLALGVGGNETILVVEDDHLVRDLVIAGLEARGYAVLAAGSAEAALALLERKEGKVDLVVIDVVLPGISGPELVWRIRQAHPGIRALMTTGYSEKSIQEYAIPDDIVPIAKPFTVARLDGAIRAALGTRLGARSNGG